MQNIYLDHNATVPMHKDAIDVFLKYAHIPLNASSIHTFGRDAKKILSDAKHDILSFLGLGDSHRCIVTPSATYSNNLILRGMGHLFQVITTTIEHPSVIETVGVGLVDVDRDGLINLGALEKVLQNTKGRVLFSMIFANNETGVIQDLEAVLAVCKKYNALLHIDASQALCKIEFDAKNIDAVTISGHKIGAGVGSAALIIKKDLEVLPILFGGPQESRICPGTQNIPSIATFAAMCHQEQITQHQKTEILRDDMEKEISQICTNAIIASKNAKRLPNTSCIVMPNVESQTQMAFFDIGGVMISNGSACSSGVVNTSRVLLSMGYGQNDANCAIRVSLGVGTTKKETKRFVELWQELYLQSMAQ